MYAYPVCTVPKEAKRSLKSEVIDSGEMLCGTGLLCKNCKCFHHQAITLTPKMTLLNAVPQAYQFAFQSSCLLGNPL